MATPGYVYILQNPLYGAYVVKIGLTTREPDVRAKELYTGSSGVPAPFDVAIAYSVGDCGLAEKLTHKRLAAYRLNKRREFFRTSPKVAAAVALDSCARINQELGLPPPELFKISKASTQNTNSRKKETRPDRAGYTAEAVPFFADPFTLRESPMGTSTLSSDQLDRIEILKMQLAQVYPDKIMEMLSGFSRDTYPEQEILIWEHITKAYLTIEEVEFAGDHLRHEAFNLLLMRSWAPLTDVLNSFRLQHLTRKSAKRLLKSYELKPLPILVHSRPKPFVLKTATP
ncbi:MULTISPECIES: GIY-YIG nuclease family protein [Pseudomonas]|uniref:GIY-YIG nuclease family protein n=1 Tax=Pseudomonas TaxID=286 RepID=UPI00073A3039|nr:MULTISPECIES: GIY-YIG nuclease family protein [Pseudomonas]UKL10808.1 GIY-YIG nuclease family protein [Pseudomonas savastanoi pv. savastanoi]